MYFVLGLTTDFEISAPDRTENLVLGKMFVVLSRGAAFPIVPHSGIYYNDMRYVSSYSLRLDGKLLTPIDTRKNGKSLNYDYDNDITRTISLHYGAFEDRIHVTSKGQLECEITPDFSDIFHVRETARGNSPESRFNYEHRSVIHMKNDSTEIDCITPVGATIYKMYLDSKSSIARIDDNNRIVLTKKEESTNLKILMYIASSPQTSPQSPNLYDSIFPALECDDLLFQSLYEDSVTNLVNALDDPSSGSYFPLGAVPWYHAIFGRDAAITSLHSVLFCPQIIESTIRTLGQLIGKRYNANTEEEPGKIIHEKRFGMTSGKDPQLQGYYGSIDATPLYALAYAELATLNPSSRVLGEYQGAFEQSIKFIESKIQISGFLGYSAGKMLRNQGWKDSEDSVFHYDGSTPTHPLYLIEVQAYAAAALCAASKIRHDQEKKLEELSSGIARGIEQKFYSEELGYYGEAIDGQDRLTRIVTSNPSHMLWMKTTRDDERASRIAKVLVDTDLLNSGYGVKTLSFKEAKHDPRSYHNGSVWPHDTMIAIRGLANYRLTDEFSILLSQLLEAHSSIGLTGLPELFSGERRVPGQKKIEALGGFPIPWCDSGILGIIHSMLGITVENNDCEITLRLNPILPNWMNRMSLKGLYLFGGRANVAMKREGKRIDTKVSFSKEPKEKVKLEIA